MVFWGTLCITFNCELVHKVHLSSSKVPPKIRTSTPLFWAQKSCGAFQHTGWNWLSTEFTIPLKSCPLPQDSLKSRMIFKWNPFVPRGYYKYAYRRVSVGPDFLYLMVKKHGRIFQDPATIFLLVLFPAENFPRDDFKRFLKKLFIFKKRKILIEINIEMRGNVKNSISLFGFILDGYILRKQWYVNAVR